MSRRLDRDRMGISTRKSIAQFLRPRRITDVEGRQHAAFRGHVKPHPTVIGQHIGIVPKRQITHHLAAGEIHHQQPVIFIAGDIANGRTMGDAKPMGMPGAGQGMAGDDTEADGIDYR